MEMLKLSTLMVIIALVVFSSDVFSQTVKSPEIKTTYDEDSGKTSVILPLMKLPNNKKSFSVGAAFQFNGEVMKNRPCCATIIFTSIGKKAFDYKDNHKVSFWADKEEFRFDNTEWREANEATAFVIAGIAFPEEIYIGMETEKFLKIARAKRIRARVGTFTFELTSEQRVGLAKLADKIDAAIKQSVFR